MYVRFDVVVCIYYCIIVFKIVRICNNLNVECTQGSMETRAQDYKETNANSGKKTNSRDK